MAIVSALGLGSGMDINGIVRQLVEAEGQPAFNALDRRESETQTRLSALGKLKSALSDFQAALKDLGNGDVFKAFTATSGNESLATISAGSFATPGVYSLEVTQLAKSQKLISGGAGFSGFSDTVGAGTLNISVGADSFSLNIDATNNTLSGVRDAINSAADNTGVNASIINVDDGSGGTVSRLVLTSRETGTANAITITAADDDGNNTDAAGLSQLVYDPAGSGVSNMTQQTAALDAIIKVDGQSVTRSSNSINDAIAGVTIDLNAAEVGTVFDINIDLDTDSVREAVSGFVEAYNSLQTVMKDLGKFDPESQVAGALIGDSSLRNIQNQIRQVTGGLVSSANGDFNSLAMVGVEIDRFGVMSIDSGRFGEVMSSNMNAVKDVFSSADGIAVRLNSSMDTFLQSGGLLDSQTSSLSDRLRSISDERDRVQLRLDNYEKVLLDQFIAMDVAVGQFQSTGAYLAQQIAALS